MIFTLALNLIYKRLHPHHASLLVSYTISDCGYISIQISDQAVVLFFHIPKTPRACRSCVEYTIVQCHLML